MVFASDLFLRNSPKEKPILKTGDQTIAITFIRNSQPIMYAITSQITALHSKAAELLRPRGRAPTRTEYAAALEHADAAMELAQDSDLSQEVKDMCKTFQNFCYAPLERCYAKTQRHEEDVYYKNSSKTSIRQKRRGKMFSVDKGEHLLEALHAVHISRVLEKQHESMDTQALNRKVHWADEDEDVSIREVRIFYESDRLSETGDY
ncbi:hypothetical protein GGR54DRAFT_654602 [Hypoxylon sp. NC1633]|nr:hypothetical protein GGR54DRAFT_654602 [Hypoxylon sp. NC1633]